MAWPMPGRRHALPAHADLREQAVSVQDVNHAGATGRLTLPAQHDVAALAQGSALRHPGARWTNEATSGGSPGRRSAPARPDSRTRWTAPTPNALAARQKPTLSSTNTADSGATPRRS